MGTAWIPSISTSADGNQSNREIEHVDSRWYNTTEYPQIKEKSSTRTENINETRYTHETRNKKEFNLGVERTKQRNALRNEIYARVLSAKMEIEEEATGWETQLKQIFKVIDQLPLASTEGRVYVCEDGEMGIVWENEEQRVEISAGVLPNVEYLVWKEEGTSIESEWDIGGEEHIPLPLREALEKQI